MSVVIDLEKDVNKLARSYLSGGIYSFIPFGHLLGLRYLNSLGEVIGKNYPYRFLQGTSFVDSTPDRGITLIKASRDEGIQSIAHGLADDVTENAWIFIPEKELWINDAMSRNFDTCSGDPYLRRFLSYIFPQVELVHTHPDKMLETLFRKGMYSQHYFIQGACPTTYDLLSLTMQHINSNHSSRMIGRVISHYGYCDYELTPQNKKLFAGGRCTDMDSKFIIEPHNAPEAEIEKLLKDQERRCSILRYELEIPSRIVPAFNFNFNFFPHKR